MDRFLEFTILQYETLSFSLILESLPDPVYLTYKLSILVFLAILVGGSYALQTTGAEKQMERQQSFCIQGRAPEITALPMFAATFTFT